jgi:hypothetical protein
MAGWVFAHEIEVFTGLNEGQSLIAEMKVLRPFYHQGSLKGLKAS